MNTLPNYVRKEEFKRIIEEERSKYDGSSGKKEIVAK
jgi:hypothetical protein